mmetsp:Transcript_47759/g.154964  ORF Transcript_47759/g.154964 Transcript_47759/m.154964 type:complete len:420 (+) Transcript_47759:14-1273(+)
MRSHSSALLSLALPLAAGFSATARPQLTRGALASGLSHAAPAQLGRTGGASMLADGFASLLADAAILLPDDAAASAGAAAAEAAQEGWFDLIVIRPFEYAIEQLASIAGYGPAIIIFTLGIKLLLFPLTKQQIESTQKMQAIGPAAKALQEKYRDRDPARLNVELQKLYQDNEVNPLAGCLPAFAQIPLFIGLYRSLLLLAKEDKLEQPFLWLPSLEGPVADYQQGIGWLTEWVNGAPKFGWADTAAYLVLPVLLVLSQYASMELLTPKSDDPAQAQSQAILKFLPLMIGWFSLNVPSGLGLYWLTNNIVTTASTLAIRAMAPKVEIKVAGGSGGAAATMEPTATKGFGGRRFGEVIESEGEGGAKIKIKPPGAAAVVEATVAETVTEATAVEATPVVDAAVSEAPRKTTKKKKKKKRN